jgi:hypothetical protein
MVTENMCEDYNDLSVIVPQMAGTFKGARGSPAPDHLPALNGYGRNTFVSPSVQPGPGSQEPAGSGSWRRSPWMRKDAKNPDARGTLLRQIIAADPGHGSRNNKTGTTE